MVAAVVVAMEDRGVIACCRRILVDDGGVKLRANRSFEPTKA